MFEYENNREERRKEWVAKMQQRGRAGRVWTGVFILIVGVFALMRSFDVPLPNWLFTWQMLLIGIGFFVGLRHGFRRGGWFVPIIIGAIFLVNDYFLDTSLRHHLWPVILIVMGIIFILKPKKHNWDFDCDYKKKGASSPGDVPFDKENTFAKVKEIREELIDCTSVFGSSKKNILSKNFRGGDIVNIFGGTELDLSQADIQDPASLEVTAIFGGTKLVVPSNWSVKSDVVSIFGGVADKRPVSAIHENPEKVLVLRGTVLFGGIEIKSF